MAELELTILMPCLNEAETLATCIGKARGFLERTGIAGEVLIADNGSTDGSQAIAEAAAPYLGRLLELPAFLRGGGPATPADLAAAFALTGHFLDLHVWSPRQLAPPATREPLIHILAPT